MSPFGDEMTQIIKFVIAKGLPKTGENNILE